MATVKGDVHDIGKNIVGVVLACNNYEIIDLGVMVPAAKILATARDEKVDAIGLSGLITPSLDEMCFVAAEMEREGFEVPLLIGGATTSRVHTAVKIHPNYVEGPGGLCDRREPRGRCRAVACSRRNRAVRTIDDVRAEYGKVAEAHRRSEADKQRLPLAKARANALQDRLGSLCAAAPAFTGTRVFRTYDVGELVPYIDWTPFFQTWELRGRYPAILDDEKQGRGGAPALRRRAGHAEARRRGALVRSEGRDRLLAGECDRRRYRALHRRVAHGEARDVLHACASNCRGAMAAPISRLRISSRRPRSGKADYIGAFVVTSGARKTRSPSVSPRPMTIMARSW